MSEMRSTDEREEEFLKLVYLKGTIDILTYLNEHGTAQYKDLIELVNGVTLYNRVKQLLEFDLIIHCLDKKDVRKEWYEITERGKKVLKIAEAIIQEADRGRYHRQTVKRYTSKFN